jgi:hypothetical protein
MKQAIAIASVLLSLALLAGCEGRAPAQAQGREVVRPSLRFALDVPAGWTVRDLNGDVVLEILTRVEKGAARPAEAPAEAAATPGARPAAAQEPGRPRAVVHVLVIEREERTLKDWADRAVKDSQELQPDLEVTAETPTKLSDGREALKVTLKSPRGIEPLIQEMLLAMTESSAYAVIATAKEKDAPAAAPEFRKCFDSFIVW